MNTTHTTPKVSTTNYDAMNYGASDELMYAIEEALKDGYTVEQVTHMYGVAKALVEGVNEGITL